MLGVGIEDVVGDRRELGKGSNLDAATRFIDSAKEYLAVRALLLLGLPNHYHLPKEEIKQRMLTYMKDHPQAVYRINILTPTPGTIDYENYANALIDNPHQNPAFLSKFDNMHSLVDPRRMREKLGITNLDNNQDYVQTPQDWEELRKEITLHYLGSEEHARFIESLKGKEVLGKQDLLYNITRKFKEINN